MRTSLLALVIAATIVTWGGRASAQGPAFECAKAQGQVETLICKDAGLAALDRKLDEVYKAAIAKARDGLAATLRTEQRGWVSGRNECWKVTGPDEATFLTESWRVDNIHDCVEGQYKVRISELQAVWQLAPSKKPAFFACQNNPANEIVATFFETDPPTARLERGDRTVTAWLVPAASGVKYEGQNVSFRNKGNEAMVTWMNPATGQMEELQCRVR